jgi:hypothetical protein
MGIKRQERPPHCSKESGFYLSSLSYICKINCGDERQSRRCWARAPLGEVPMERRDGSEPLE